MEPVWALPGRPGRSERRAFAAFAASRLMALRTVIALGGNALQRAGTSGTWSEAVRQMRRTAPAIVRVARSGREILLTHGNGPQVGALLRSSELAAREIPAPPMPAVDAQSEGQIGYLIEQEIDSALTVARARRHVAALITRMEVSPRDPEFRSPSKPVGRFYTEIEARRLRKSEGWTMVHDTARGGWRRVVASPKPLRWLEADLVKGFFEFGLGSHWILVTGGGGGIAVVRRARGRFEGVDAVIDKDLGSAVIASAIGADTLAIVTDVPGVATGFGTPSERWLGATTLEELERLSAAGEFPKGTMGPKVEAGIDFLRAGGREFVVTDIPSLDRALRGEAGTRVRPRR